MIITVTLISGSHVFSEIAEIDKDNLSNEEIIVRYLNSLNFDGYVEKCVKKLTPNSYFDTTWLKKVDYKIYKHKSLRRI